MLGLRGQQLPWTWVLLLLPVWLLLLLPAAPAPRGTSYKPVIVVHGLFDSSYSFRHLLEYINEVCGGGAPPAKALAVRLGGGETAVVGACPVPRGVGLLARRELGDQHPRF